MLIPLSPVVAGQATAKKKARPARRFNPAWPLPPEKPRIKLIGVIYGDRDVGPIKDANLLDRLAGIETKDSKPTFVKPFIQRQLGNASVEITLNVKRI